MRTGCSARLVCLSVMLVQLIMAEGSALCGAGVSLFSVVKEGFSGDHLAERQTDRQTDRRVDRGCDAGSDPTPTAVRTGPDLRFRVSARHVPAQGISLCSMMMRSRGLWAEPLRRATAVRQTNVIKHRDINGKQRAVGGAGASARAQGGDGVPLTLDPDHIWSFR